MDDCLERNCGGGTALTNQTHLLGQDGWETGCAPPAVFQRPAPPPAIRARACAGPVRARSRQRRQPVHPPQLGFTAPQPHSPCHSAHSLADSNQPSALRPWHARSFMDSALQRLSVALQRTIQRDQVLRSHLRRVQRGGVPADYYECGGDAGYRRSSSPSSSGSGSSSRTRGHRGVSSP